MLNRSLPFAIFALLAAVFSASAVFAGFEWVPPGGAQQPPALDSNDPTLTPGPVGPQAPLQPVSAQPLMPATPVTPAAPVAAAPVIPAPVAAAPIPAPTPLIKIKSVTAPAPAPVALPASQPGPQINWNPPAAMHEAAAPPQQPVRPVMIKPQISKRLIINPYPQKTAATPQVAPVPFEATLPLPPATNDSFSTVVGFGSDMPLALALQQIAPPEYIFSFGDNVNPGTNISWDGGGRPWNQVVTDAIAPLGLEARIDGKTVHIARGGMTPEEHSAAIIPQAGDSLSPDETDIHRGNITDPGETPKKQPLSTPVSAPVEIQANAAAPETPAAEAATETVKEAEAMPLLPADTAPAPVVVRGVWEVRQGDSLKETFDAWSKKANVDLVWDSTHDYTVEADMTVNDSFQTAVEAVVAHGVKTGKPVVKIENESKNGKAGTLIVQDQS